MALELTTNFATSTVATAPSPATSGTSLVVGAGHGARFPAGAQDFNAIICPADAQPTPANAEVVRVTSISTDTFTITRAQEGSSARTVVVGDRIFAGVTAKTLADIDTSLSAINLDLAFSTVRNSMLDAKGDMYAASAADAPARLGPIGANETAIVADSAQTVGMKWATPLGGLLGYVPIHLDQTARRAAGGTALTNAAISPLGGFQVTGGANPQVTPIPIFAADLNVTGRTTNLKTRLLIVTNATAPTISFTAGLSEVTAAAGGADSINMTWGNPVSGSTCTVTTPAASSRTWAVSSAFTMPSDGFYILTFTMSGAMPATNPTVLIGMSLFGEHV